jgi:pyruvate carboxylase
VTVVDKSLEPDTPTNIKAEPGNPSHIGASMPGMVVTVDVQAGDSVSKGQKLLSLEAMKMETNVHAEREGKIGQVLVRPRVQVAAGDLLMTYT